jgi:glycosyltransferase involved in cell wall biosynthesis
LESILSQLNDGDEIVISDDSSTDETIKIIKSFKDPRIKVIENRNGRFHLINFENAISHARHDLIFLSDQDDIWVEGKVSAVTRELETCDLVNTDHSVIDEKGNVIVKSYFSEVTSRPGVIKNLLKCSYFGCCMAFNRRVFDKAYPFPRNITSHDVWLGHVADLFFKVKFLNFPYTLYRKHDNNFSTAADPKSKNSIWKKLKFRYFLIINTLPLFFKKANV